MTRMLREFLPSRNLAFAPDLVVAMSRYRWPGNLRRLNNALRTACALLDDTDALIDWAHLPDDLAGDLRGAPSVRDEVDDVADLRARAEHTVKQIVQSSAGHLSAARRLGISRNTLYRKLREMDPR